MESKVYVLSNNGFDFEPAKQFGELVFLTTGFVDAHKDFEYHKERFTNILKDAKQEDFLLLVGINLMCVLAYDIMKEQIGGSPINILHWNSIERSYVQYTF